MLTTCPVCDYALAGLPAAHRCPECGFEYDERTRTWQHQRPWWVGAAMLGVVAFFAAWVPVAVRDLFKARSIDASWVISAVLFSVLGALAVRDFLQLRRRRTVLATAPRELLVRRDRALLRIPWTQVWGATWTRAALTIHGRGAWNPLVLPQFFENEAQFAEFNALLTDRSAAAGRRLEGAPEQDAV